MGDLDDLDLQSLFEALMARPFDEDGEWEVDGIPVITNENGHLAVLDESESFASEDDGGTHESAETDEAAEFDEAAEADEADETDETDEVEVAAEVDEDGVGDDDEVGERVMAAAEVIDAKAEELKAELTAKWGAPKEFDAFPLMRAIPPPAIAVLLLDNGAGGAWLWEQNDFALGLATGQVDEDSPIQLLAFVSSRVVG